MKLTEPEEQSYRLLAHSIARALVNLIERNIVSLDKCTVTQAVNGMYRTCFAAQGPATTDERLPTYPEKLLQQSLAFSAQLVTLELRAVVDQAYLDYEEISICKGAGSIEGQKAYGIWADALDAYNKKCGFRNTVLR